MININFSRYLTKLLPGLIMFFCILTGDMAIPQEDSTNASLPGGLIAEGTRWETSYYVKDTGNPGPSVLIVGGIHGSEPAGSEAVSEIMKWNITRGRIIFIPRANEVSLKNSTRLMPVDENRNLNRNFPYKDDETVKCELSEAIWAFVSDVNPNWVLDLHESKAIKKLTGKSFGNSIIYYPKPGTKTIAAKMIESVNETIKNPKHEFILMRYPAEGSLTRAAAELLDSSAMILETTWKDQPMELRVNQHLIMVEHFLIEQDMLASAGSDMEGTSGKVDLFLPRGRADGEIRVAIFEDHGTDQTDSLKEKLMPMNDLYVESVDASQILNDVLSEFDVLIVPGGYMGPMVRALTEEGREKIREFVKNGGGYIGFCAGAYLAANNFSWSLKIIDANVIDLKHWFRGEGLVNIELTDAGKIILAQVPGDFQVYYKNGPILEFADNPDIPDFIPLATFKSEITDYAPRGMMIDTPAIITGQFGKGKVFISSPHPETTWGLGSIVRQSIVWASGRQVLGE